MQSYTQTCHVSSEEAQAHRLIRSAVQKLESGDVQEAVKCLHRAESIYPTPEAKKILKDIQTKTDKSHKTNTHENQGGQCTNEATGSKQNYSREELHSHRKYKINSSTVLDYTLEQFAAVHRVIICDNHYDVLTVTPTASCAEIKEAYKKLALLVHPDKNKAPQAKKAFQAVGIAKDILTNPIKRRGYDNQRIRQQFAANVSNAIKWTLIGGAGLIVGAAVLVVGIVAASGGGRKSSKEDDDEDDE